MQRFLAVLALAGALAGVAPPASAQTAAPAPASAPATVPVTVETIHQYLIGTWQNDADTRFTRELDANGRALDRLLGEERDSVPGSWSVFFGAAPPAKFASMKFGPKAIYLEIDQDDDTLLFQLVQVSHSDMEMIYLQQNKPLSFSRLK